MALRGRLIQDINEAIRIIDDIQSDFEMDSEGSESDENDFEDLSSLSDNDIESDIADEAQQQQGVDADDDDGFDANLHFNPDNTTSDNTIISNNTTSKQDVHHLQLMIQYNIKMLAPTNQSSGRKVVIVSSAPSPYEKLRNVVERSLDMHQV